MGKSNVFECLRSLGSHTRLGYLSIALFKRNASADPVQISSVGLESVLNAAFLASKVSSLPAKNRRVCEYS